MKPVHTGVTDPPMITVAGNNLHVVVWVEPAQTRIKHG